MEKEGKTIEGYQRIIELTKKIEMMYRGPELSWDWETKEKLLTDWKKDYKGRFEDCLDPHFSPDGEKIAATVKDKKGWTIAVNGQTWEERFEWCGDPHFSPDGEKIMVIVRKDGKYYRLVKEV
jgi:Tol biopolymer transport system component